MRRSINSPGDGKAQKINADHEARIMKLEVLLVRNNTKSSEMPSRDVFSSPSPKSLRNDLTRRGVDKLGTKLIPLK